MEIDSQLKLNAEEQLRGQVGFGVAILERLSEGSVFQHEKSAIVLHGGVHVTSWSW